MRRTLYTLCLALGAGWLLPLPSQAQQRTEADALTVAQGFLNRKHTGGEIAASKLKLAELPLKGLAKAPGATHATANAYYLVENDENNELVIVSGDYRMPEVLGYTNRLSSGEMPEGLLTMLDIYQEQFELMQEDPRATSCKAKRTTAVPVVKEKLLPTAEWGSEAPFNKLIPYGKSVPSAIVASAIIMNYHQWPAQGKGSVSYTNDDGKQFDCDFSQSHYDWSSLPARFDEGSYSEAQADAVAQIMYDLSLGSEINYTISGTSYSSGKVRKMFYKYFSYYPGLTFTESREIEDYIAEIDANRPVLYCAVNSSNDRSTAFVIDGYYNEFAHINWGSNGDYNGYYILYNTYKGDRKYQYVSYAICQIEPEAESENYSNIIIQSNRDNNYTGIISTHSDIQAGKPFGLYISNLDYLTGSGPDTAAVVLCNAEGQVKDWLAYYALNYTNDNVYLSCNPTVDAAEGDYLTLRGKTGDKGAWMPLRSLKEGNDRLPAVGYEPPHVQLQADVEQGLEIENMQPNLLFQGNPILFHPYVCSVKLPEGKDVLTFQIDGQLYAPDSIVDGKVYYTSLYTTAEPHKLSIHTLTESEMVKGLRFTLGQGQTLEEYIHSVTDRPETVAELTLEGPLLDVDADFLFGQLLSLRHLDLTEVYDQNKSYDFKYHYAALPLLFLTDFQLPKSLKNVCLYASKHPLLKSITFPADFQRSTIFSLEGSYALREINSLAVVPPTIVINKVPQQIADEAVLHVPVGSKAAYETAKFWKNYQNIVEDLPAREVFFTENGFNYEVEINADDADEVILRGCSLTDSRLEIPAEVEHGGKSYKVVGIASNAFYRSSYETVVLPSTLRYLQNSAFSSSKISSVEAKDCELETIDAQAFYNCTNLRDFQWPKNLKKIGDRAFSYCALDSIILPDKVTYIDANAFYGCNNVRKIHLSPVTEYIGYFALNCNSKAYLDTTVLPSTLKYLGEDALSYMAFHQTDVVIPASLEYYGNEALAWNIIVGFKVEEGNTILRCENGMLLDADYRRLNQYARPDTLVDLKVPEGVETIAMAVGCQFDKIKTLSLPSTLTLVKDAAFAKCSGLTDVTIHAVIPPVIESLNYYPFEDCYDKATLHVPAEALSYYQSHPFWSRFTNIKAIDPSAIQSVEAVAADAQGVFRVCGDRFDLQLNAESEVKVYDTAGRLVSSQRLAAGSHSITLPAQGVYVVKTK